MEGFSETRCLVDETELCRLMESEYCLSFLESSAFSSSPCFLPRSDAEPQVLLRTPNELFPRFPEEGNSFFTAMRKRLSFFPFTKLFLESLFFFFFFLFSI